METPTSSPPEPGAALKGGWRIKERKPRQVAASDRRDAAIQRDVALEIDTQRDMPGLVEGTVGLAKSLPKRAADLAMPLLDHGWRHRFGVLSSIGIVAGALMIVIGLLSVWFSPSGVSQPAIAETFATAAASEAHAATEVPAERETPKETVLQQDMPKLDQAYRLHLGAYPSELSARLAWAGLQANSNMLLEGLDPSFDRQESDGGTFYHVLAGAYSRRHLADNHCSWLTQHEVDCFIVDG